MFWEGCPREVPRRLSGAIELRDAVMQDGDASELEIDEAARRVAEIVTSLRMLGCDEEVRAELRRS
ncbi:MAG TPA: hypothetical protein VHI31_07060 [Actinomycetota bacterium]|nr:hypothetical protein [Actinomycetota bacterium]